MVYIIGIIGFIGGFVLGQMALYFFLRHKSNEELLNDKWLKWQYGTMNWIVAAFGAYASIQMYEFYFGS